MLQNRPKETVTVAPQKIKHPFYKNKQLLITVGILLQGAGVFLCISFISHFFYSNLDQSTVESCGRLGVQPSGTAIRNWLGIVGALSAYYFVFRWFGISSFFLLLPIYAAGHRLSFGKLPRNINLYTVFIVSILSTLWLSSLIGYIAFVFPYLASFCNLMGGAGVELGIFFNALLGYGTLLLLFVVFIIIIVHIFGIEDVSKLFDLRFLKKPKEKIPVNVSASFQSTSNNFTDTAHNAASEISSDINYTNINLEVVNSTNKEHIFSLPKNKTENPLSKEYDSKLGLSVYEYPTIDLLNDYSQNKIPVPHSELTQNKDKIIETLINFKIGIVSIKATIGPTVTLYEIIPDAGVKISKIKNLEDDIALSLAALGIRIIAPIPGKGTIGIEVPNKNREIVSLKSIISSDKFEYSNMELPIVMGKTIANEVWMADLASMPHLLIAGATGQGKSVGLNVVLTSLIYKKHPSQLKLVLVDPKKVELSLYNKLEKHFLAKLPGDDEAIITEVKKVIKTLNSLCLEMDQRYELLKEAGVRNIKEYNSKFVKRLLDPKDSHRFLPYIVLVIDEFADMIMVAGKEIELPIARLAQLARAVGIHLVLATQRPSVNVITGTIKANFPVRISYRVTSKIDSRTILDTGGAEQLVGRGDMLLSMNSEVIRLQCPFLDTDEVERVCGFIGRQNGYASAYILPECDDEDEQSDQSTGDKEVDEYLE